MPYYTRWVPCFTCCNLSAFWEERAHNYKFIFEMYRYINAPRLLFVPLELQQVLYRTCNSKYTHLLLEQSVGLSVRLVSSSALHDYAVQDRLLKLLEPGQKELLLGGHFCLVDSQRQCYGSPEDQCGADYHRPPREVGVLVYGVQHQLCSLD